MNKIKTTYDQIRLRFHESLSMRLYRPFATQLSLDANKLALKIIRQLYVPLYVHIDSELYRPLSNWLQKELKNR